MLGDRRGRQSSCRHWRDGWSGKPVVIYDVPSKRLVFTLIVIQEGTNVTHEMAEKGLGLEQSKEEVKPAEFAELPERMARSMKSYRTIVKSSARQLQVSMVVRMFET